MSGPLRVLYVLRYYPTLSETFVTRELHALLARGVRVVIAALGRRGDGALAEGLPDVPVLRPPRRHAAAWLHARVGEVERVHAHFDGEASAVAAALARRRGVPYSVTVHGVDLFKPHAGIARRLAEASPVIAVCEHHRRWIAHRYGVQSVVVRCGVELDGPQAQPAREPARVIAVAREVPKKAIGRLRRAASGTALELHRATPHATVRRRLAQAQLFALPCRVAPDGDRDGVPVAMMEAMAAGLPVVTRPVGGIPELVDHTVGWIGEDFERLLAEALASPEQRARRGAAARARVARAWTTHRSALDLLAAWGRLAP